MTEYVWYATQEMIEAELPAANSTMLAALIRRKLGSSSQSVERLTKRRFYPWTGTKSFPWPNDQYAPSWKVYFDQPDQLVSLTSVTAGGTAVDTADLYAEPTNTGPPYSRIEINRGSSASWRSGTTPQRSLAFVGIWGNDYTTTSTGAVAEDVDASETAIDVNGIASAALGVGSLLICESERMIVTDRAMLTTGQTLASANLTAVESDRTVNVASSAGFAVGETILLDSERMLITDIAGNALTVTRAYAGTTLAAHTIGATIYAPRTLTVTRGALGTTAATHSTSTALSRFVYPPLVEQLTIAETVNEVLQGAAGWGRTTGGEQSREMRIAGLQDLRKRVLEAHGRRARKGTI